MDSQNNFQDPVEYAFDDDCFQDESSSDKDSGIGASSDKDSSIGASSDKDSGIGSSISEGEALMNIQFNRIHDINARIIDTYKREKFAKEALQHENDTLKAELSAMQERLNVSEIKHALRDIQHVDERSALMDRATTAENKISDLEHAVQQCKEQLALASQTQKEHDINEIALACQNNLLEQNMQDMELQHAQQLDAQHN
jgi:FtsZ-binding cell division protein ZapB